MGFGDMLSSGFNKVKDWGSNMLSNLPSGEDITKSFGDSQGPGSILQGTKAIDPVPGSYTNMKAFNKAFVGDGEHSLMDGAMENFKPAIEQDVSDAKENIINNNPGDPGSAGESDTQFKLKNLFKGGLLRNKEQLERPERMDRDYQGINESTGERWANEDIKVQQEEDKLKYEDELGSFNEQQQSGKDAQARRKQFGEGISKIGEQMSQQGAYQYGLLGNNEEENKGRGYF